MNPSAQKLWVLILCGLTIGITIGIIGPHTSAIHLDTTNPVDLGIIDYNPLAPATKSITLENSTQPLILTLISTDQLPSYALNVISNYYNAGLNETYLVFQVAPLNPPYYFDNTTLRTIVYHGNDNRIYTVSINYTSLQLPSNPLINLNQTINSLVSNLSIYQTLHNESLQDLNKTKGELRNLNHEYNLSLINNTNASKRIQDLEDIIEQKRLEIANLSTKASSYETQYNTTKKELFGYFDSEDRVYREFYFNRLLIGEGGVYGNYLLEKQAKDNTINIAVYLFIAMIIIFVFIMIYHRMKRKPQTSIIGIERDTGYGKKQFIADGIISKGKSFFNAVIHLGKKDSPKKTDETKPPDTQNHQHEKTNIQQLEQRIEGCENLTDIHTHDIQYQRKKIEELTTKYTQVDTRTKDISKKVDELLTQKILSDEPDRQNKKNQK